MQDRPALKDDVELLPVDDGYMILDKAEDRVHYLNPTAALVALSCDGAATSEEIARSIQEQFGLDTPPVAEVTEVLGRLRDEGLLRLP
jgi:hypothetical protein